MRCLSCDRKLRDAELSRKSLLTGEYIDMCNNCFSTIADDVPTIGGFNSGITTEEEDTETFDDADDSEGGTDDGTDHL